MFVMHGYLCTYVVYIGVYFTGDGALRDENGLYRITGRVDDIIMSKGHRIGTAELECAMVSSQSLAWWRSMFVLQPVYPIAS